MTGFYESFVGMRSERLVALLLLLQRREQVTAAEVSRELGVSERTARRDLDALAMAGVPVYSVQGRAACRPRLRGCAAPGRTAAFTAQRGTARPVPRGRRGQGM
ncbi:hypothetical protein SBADM41S_08932 [Streptomyces badius]